MTNRLRKTLLFGALGAIVAFYAGDWLFQRILAGPRQERIDRGEQLVKRIEQRENELAAALKAGRKLETFEALSLPSDPEIAVSYYRSWLTELGEYAHFTNLYVDVGTPLNRKGMYQSIDCSIRASAKLEQLLTFLFEFYHAGHLHQIQRIGITPAPRRAELDLDIAIQALILPTADRKDRGSTREANRLAFASLDDYRLIAERNFFGFEGPGVHLTDQTFLTAVVQVNERPQAWFTVRTRDEVLKLSPGDPLQVGQFRGTIQDIAERDVILESEGERWLMTVGESLAQAVALPPEF